MSDVTLSPRKKDILLTMRAAHSRLEDREIPIYGEVPYDSPPGLYLGLFHGFASEKDRSEWQDWGANGPLIGPLEYVHTTYAESISFRFREGVNYERYGFSDQENLLFISDGLFEFDGMYYGDWTVFSIDT